MKLIIDKLAVELSGRVVFSDLSFCLKNGEAAIITGSNGSGKSTLLDAIAGLQTASSGNISFSCFGKVDLSHHLSDNSNANYSENKSAEVTDIALCEIIHYLGHKNGLKLSMSVAENLQFWQNFSGKPFMSIDDALEEVGLIYVKHTPVVYLSAGQKRRVAIARLLLCYKPIWIVDEPTTSLDKDAEQLFENMVKNHLENGGIAIVATHKIPNFKVDDGFNIHCLCMDEYR